MLEQVTERIDRVRQLIVRATLAPLLVRCGIAVSLVLAMTVAWPIGLVASQGGVLLVLVALYPAVAPRGRGTTAVILVAVLGWLMSTSWSGAHVVLWRVLLLAALIYLGHTLAALAAVLPYDAIVNLDVVTWWVARALLVILISTVLTVITLGLTADLAGGAFLVATLVGLGAAVATALLLVRLVRRPGH